MKKLLALLLLFGIVGCAVEEVKKVAYVSGNEEGTYEGEWKDGQPNGQGTWTAPDGSNYVGEWKDGNRHGQGTLTYFGGKYVGEWKDGKQHGQGTKTDSPLGGKYVGEWKDGKRHGQGTKTDSSGGKYVGEWKDGKRHGQGTYTWASGSTYEGEWKDFERNGQGTMTYANGNTYVGEWKDHEKHGQGTMTYANGKKEVGEFKDGEYVGGLKDGKSVEKSLREQLSEAGMKLLKGPTKNIELYEACSKDFQRYMQPFLDLRAERLKLGDQSAARDYYDNHLPLGNEMYLRCFRDGLRF